MIGQVPPFVNDLIAYATLIGVTIGSALALRKFGPARWVWKHLVSDPLGEWFDKRTNQSATSATDDLRAQIADFRDDFDDHCRYVNYHMGPNGKTKPLHLRMAELEIAHAIEPPYDLDDWVEGYSDDHD